MLSHRIAVLLQNRSILNLPNVILTHTATCPTRKGPVCPDKKGSGLPIDTPPAVSHLVRAKRTAPVRLGFLPEDWFLMFRPITGVSGPYVFGIVVMNYLLSKEIFIMEHEYYLGLSFAVVVYYITTKYGRDIGKSLDAQVDAIQDEWEKGRRDEINIYKASKQGAEQAIMSAQGQRLLMDAKKENISMQLEAIYRERMMEVYRMTKNRMDYHIKRSRAEMRVHQKWMIEWILNSVRRSITPEFEQRALDAAIQELPTIARKT